MRILKWFILVLAFVVAGWFAFEGSRALLVGDYLTPRTGDYAGQLGPWSRLVEALGIEPRSTVMKLIFLGYGLAWLGAIGAFASGRAWAWKAMLGAAVGSLWYLPFGTLLGSIQIVLLLMPAVRTPASGQQPGR